MHNKLCQITSSLPLQNLKSTLGSSAIMYLLISLPSFVGQVHALDCFEAFQHIVDLPRQLFVFLPLVLEEFASLTRSVRDIREWKYL